MRAAVLIRVGGRSSRSHLETKRRGSINKGGSVWRLRGTNLRPSKIRKVKLKTFRRSKILSKIYCLKL